MAESAIPALNPGQSFSRKATQGRSERQENPTSAISTGNSRRSPGEFSTSPIGLKGLLGIATGAIGLITAFRNGPTKGFERLSESCKTISSIVSVPFSFLFPFISLRNEFGNLKGESKTGDDNLLTRMIYTCASLGFAPLTFAEPIAAFGRGTLGKIATIANLPHIGFVAASYTGGRAMGAFIAVKKYFNKMFFKNEKDEFRLEQEFNSMYKLGNLGSAQASATAMSEQFCLGWEVLGSVFTGNFSKAAETLKEKPVSAVLGTLFNSWLFPFEWAAKFFDTSIRCAENSDNFKNAFGENNIIIKGLEKYKEIWIKNSKNKNSTLGNFLYYGREFAKVESLIGPPIGMASVVLPVFNKYCRGEIFNKEAQQKGGFVGFFDKVFSITGLLGHLYYTSIYALTIRLPQTITTSVFYLTNLRNWKKGLKPGDAGYKDPIDVRKQIFDRPWINKISDWAEKTLNKMEKQLHGDTAQTINPETKESKYIRTFVKVMAQGACYEPIRERFYAEVVRKKTDVKLSGVKPSQEEWGAALDEKIKSGTLSDEIKNVLEKYLRESPQFDDAQIEYIKNGNGKQDWDAIVAEALRLFNKEHKDCSTKHEEKKELTNGVKLPNSFIGLLTSPKALLEVLKLKFLHVSNSILPLFIKGFVNVVDFGRRDEEFWYRNFKAQQTGIEEGDYIQATDREAFPVFMSNFQNAGKGLAHLHDMYQKVFGMAA